MPTLGKLILWLVVAAGTLFAGSRTSIQLDGEWQIEESLEANAMPSAFAHRVPVPGLANLSVPPFPNVDAFDSREIIRNRIRKGALPKDTALPENNGIPHQNRNYFWYRRSFLAPAPRQKAVLKVNKAQFGISLWINGTYAGEHLGCFTAGYFDITKGIRWNAGNEVTIRIGAHPAVLPPQVVYGTDNEKLKWTPGIYDSVSVHFMDNPSIESVQVAPRIREGAVLVETVIRNDGPGTAATLSHRISEWQGRKNVASSKPETIRLAAGETKRVHTTIHIPGSKLWSPEQPFLYSLETATGSDSSSVRFGMREFRFDTATRRAYLNGNIYFLRGSNITLHRFFEDPECRGLPWNEAWVRKLLVEIPKKMHWNSFRFCIGPVPERWLEIADEAGLLIQNEYFIWTGGQNGSTWHADWDTGLLTTHAREWMRDNWNHPSVAIWDLSNESWSTALAEEVIPAVRALDLSNRPWDNGYTLPQGPDDMVEDHPYLFSQNWQGGGPAFRMAELEGMIGRKSTNSPHPSGHAAVVNEYGWLWLNRDGTPTVLTGKVYEGLLGRDSTAEQRLSLNAYLVGGLTEFWRAHRQFAGVLHFVYLTCSYPGVYTSDHFSNVTDLTLHREFADYAGEAFKPLGVYVNFWQPTLQASSLRHYSVSMVNDCDRPLSGQLNLAWERPEGNVVSQTESPFQLSPAGQMTYVLKLSTPTHPGCYVLRARALPSEALPEGPTVSRRRVEIK